MLSPPKPLDKFNQIRCKSYWHEWGVQGQTLFLAPPPGALGRGQKVKYHLISITKSISKIFIPNFVCVLTNERYKTYHSVSWVMPQRWDFGVLGVPRGRDKARGQLGRNGRPRGQKIHPKWDPRRSGSLLNKKKKKNFFLFLGRLFHSVTTQSQAVVTIYYNCIVLLLPCNGKSMCNG